MDNLTVSDKGDELVRSVERLDYQAEDAALVTIRTAAVL